MKAVPHSNNLHCELRADELRTNSSTADNKGFAIAGVPCFADTFVQGES